MLHGNVNILKVWTTHLKTVKIASFMLYFSMKEINLKLFQVLVNVKCDFIVSEENWAVYYGEPLEEFGNIIIY